MANPLKVQTATTPNSLKVMSDADMDYISHVLLTDFVSTDTGIGTLSVSPVSTAGLTAIGTWSDTSWAVAAGVQLTSYTPVYASGATYTSQYTSANYTTAYQRFFAGFSGGFFISPNYTTDFTSPAYASGATYSPGTAYAPTEYGAYVSTQDQLTTVANTFYQDLEEAPETLTRPLEYDTGLNRVIQQVDNNLNASIMTNTLDRLAAFGLGSYKLQTTTPSSGGTWVAKANVTDTSSAATNTYYLWRRTTQTAPTTIRPLKTRLNGNIYDMIEMTDVDIKTLTARFRNQIVSTEIGTYSLQTSAPGVGTWTRAGEEIDDTRANAYTAAYVPGYTTQYTSPNYTTDFTSANYTTGYTSQYTSANYTSSYQRFFGGYHGGWFTSPNYTSSFQGTTFTSPNYTTDFTSANYTTDYTSTYASLTETYSGTYISAVVAAKTSTSLWIRTA